MSPLPGTGRLFAVDWGEKRIGLATSDETQTIASPLATLSRRTGKRFPMPRFLAQVAALQPVGVVVGLPLESSGEDGPAARAARELAALIGARTALPVELHDERMSTARALAARRESEGSGSDRDTIDQLAAVVILQQFLESRRPREA